MSPPETANTSPRQTATANLEAARQRRARMAEEMRQAKMLRTLTTPEGAVIRLRLATASERVGAFLIDIALQWAIVITTLLGLGYLTTAMGGQSSGVAFALWMVFFFFVRNFYYIFFEAGSRGATPGKRALGLRVAARDGGRLTANAVLARNFIREIEIGLPVQFILMSGDHALALMGLFGLIWSGIFLLFPLFNRDRMRVGDLIAGTWVIIAPKTRLLQDIARPDTLTNGSVPFSFTEQQAEAYGIHELHVLEDVLRRSQTGIRQEVAARIRRKIGWTRQEGESDLAFLQAYYAALRARLEHRMLLGDRKIDKYDVRS